MRNSSRNSSESRPEAAVSDVLVVLAVLVVEKRLDKASTVVMGEASFGAWGSFAATRRPWADPGYRGKAVPLPLRDVLSVI